MQKTRPPVRSKTPKKPAIADDVKKLHADYVAKHVLPRMQWLLDQIQTKLTRHKLKFISTQGCEYFELNGKPDLEFSDAGTAIPLKLTHLYKKPTYMRRINKHFPELCEFYELYYDLDSILRYDVGEMNPTETT